MLLSSRIAIKEKNTASSLVVQWLGLVTFHCRGFNPWSGELRSRKPGSEEKKKKNPKDKEADIYKCIHKHIRTTSQETQV